MTFDVRGHLQKRLVGQLFIAADDKGTRENERTDDSCGGGAQTSLVRDAVGADDFQSARLPTHDIESLTHDLGHEMLAIARERISTLSPDVDADSG